MQIMSEDATFRSATRRLLFKDPEPVQDIPGAGSSAAADADKYIRVKVTINLDGDVVQHFKDQARQEGIPYQTLINQTLRECIHGSKPQQLAKSVSETLLNDPRFLDAVRAHLKES